MIGFHMLRKSGCGGKNTRALGTFQANLCNVVHSYVSTCRGLPNSYAHLSGGGGPHEDA